MEQLKKGWRPGRATVGAGCEQPAPKKKYWPHFWPRRFYFFSPLMHIPDQTTSKRTEVTLEENNFHFAARGPTRGPTPPTSRKAAGHLRSNLCQGGWIRASVKLTLILPIAPAKNLLPTIMVPIHPSHLIRNDTLTQVLQDCNYAIYWVIVNCVCLKANW